MEIEGKWREVVKVFEIFFRKGENLWKFRWLDDRGIYDNGRKIKKISGLLNSSSVSS